MLEETEFCLCGELFPAKAGGVYGLYFWRRTNPPLPASWSPTPPLLQRPHAISDLYNVDTASCWLLRRWARRLVSHVCNR